MKILFYPEEPHEPYLIYKLCHALGYQLTNDIDAAHDLAIAWSDTTWRPPFPLVQELSERRVVLNIDCTDISKSRVDQIFGEVFGYKSLLDPRVHRGLCVKKSDENAMHDGEIIECPLAQTESGYVYQALLNNEVEGGLILDLRVPIFRDKIPLVYLKYREESDRFGNQNHSVTIANTDDVFSREEQQLILLFCQRLGFDLGELDVLRDRDNHRLYIIDANNTPYGPPNHISAQDAARAIAMMARCLAQIVEAR